MTQQIFWFRKIKSLAAILIISVLCACSNSKQVVFKSSGVSETFTEGKSGVPKELETYVYPDATTSGSVSADGENQEQSKFIMLSSKSSVDAVSKWYKEKLKSEQWKITNSQEQAKLISITANKKNDEFNVMVTEDNGTTNISLSMAQENEGNESDENSHENPAPNKDTPPTD